MAIKKKSSLKRLKNSSRKIPARKMNLTKRPLKKTRPQRIPVEAKEEILGQQEMAVEKTKFYAAEATKVQRPIPQELPSEYGQDKIVLQVRDPRWIHAYWEVCHQTIEKLRNELRDDFYKAKRILRVYDVSHIIFDGKNAHRFFDIHIDERADSWYVDTNGPGRSWCVDLGLLLPSGRFILIVRSNIVSTPLDGPSWITDEEWMVPEDMFSRLYGMGFGLGKSSPGKAWQERVKREFFSGAFASGGVSSLASPVKKVRGERKFWLAVNTELIVYGATEPGAKVYVQGKQVNLRRDGTFTLRFALADGKQVIPVKAVSSDKQEERTITPIVAKETK